MLFHIVLNITYIKYLILTTWWPIYSGILRRQLISVDVYD
jgi:hypothetical protein